MWNKTLKQNKSRRGLSVNQKTSLSKAFTTLRHSPISTTGTIAVTRSPALLGEWMNESLLFTILCHCSWLWPRLRRSRNRTWPIGWSILPAPWTIGIRHWRARKWPFGTRVVDITSADSHLFDHCLSYVVTFCVCGEYFGYLVSICFLWIISNSVNILSHYS